MKQPFLLALALGGAAIPAAVSAQVTATFAQPIAGTKLDINATGEVTRVPDVAIISAGVVTRSTTATAAIQENADRMERVRAALKRAGIADKDIQTSTSASTRNIATRITSRRSWSAIPPRTRSASASATSATAAGSSMRWSARAPTRSTAPTSPSTIPRARSTKRAPRRRRPAAPAPSSMRGRWACGSCACSRSAKAAAMRCRRRCR